MKWHHTNDTLNFRIYNNWQILKISQLRIWEVDCQVVGSVETELESKESFVGSDEDGDYE